MNVSVAKPRGPSWFEMLEAARSLQFLEFLIFRSPQLMRQYGGIIRTGKNQYLVADPNAFKYILKTNPNNFTRQNMTYSRLKLIFGDGLIVNEGPPWEYHRTLLQPAFDRNMLERYAKIMVKTTRELLATWQTSQTGQTRQTVPPQSIDISGQMSLLTLKIAFRAFCNYEPTPDDLTTVVQLFKLGNPHISYFPFLKSWIPTPRNLLFFRSIRRVNALLNKIIEQRKTSGDYYGDVVDILLNANKTQTIPLSPVEILDELKTLLITGHETTGCGLAWCWYLLDKHPEYRALMEEELNNTLHDRLPTIDDCVNLPITKAIFLEALRLYPTIWCLPRRVIKNDMLCSYEMKAGSELILNIYALHRNPNYWKSPETFYPPRFLGDEDAKRNPYAYLPFSVGAHGCIGAHFGTMEGILLLATLSQQVRIELVKKNKEYKPEPYISLKPPANLKMRIVPRIS